MNQEASPSVQGGKKRLSEFLPDNFLITDSASLEPYYQSLVSAKVETISELHSWLNDLSDLEAAVEEHAAWLYIRMTCDTQDKSLSDAYAYFVEQINPMIEPYADKINKKILAIPSLKQLDDRYNIYIRQVRNEIRLFTEENIPLNAELTVKEQSYGEVAGAMTVDIDGKKLTLQQASSNYLKSPDRAIRDKVYHQIFKRRAEDRQKLDDLFSELIKLRVKIAKNAGFENYIDFKFTELDRFDYSPQDCLNFHSSVKQAVIPVLDEVMQERKSMMNVPELKPWDLDVDPTGKDNLRPFSDGKDLMNKSIACFTDIHSYFGKVLTTLKEKNYTDLDSRIGKAPGGYNYPLYESGVPFIFMNASGSLRDVITMVHEGGHAIHSMLTADLEFVGFKELTAEIAELASMSMELLSMEHWNHFFTSEEDLSRAKKEHLTNIIEVLPWIACIDSFQHWLYNHPQHSIAERTEQWKKTFLSFSSTLVDWSGDEKIMEILWQKQLHLFEVPFYYIEYGMAQLGAIAVWRNFKQNGVKAIDQYMDALRLGYTVPIADVYSAAGIQFDFSAPYISELINFVREELNKL